MSEIKVPLLLHGGGGVHFVIWCHSWQWHGVISVQCVIIIILFNYLSLCSRKPFPYAMPPCPSSWWNICYNTTQGPFSRLMTCATGHQLEHQAVVTNLCDITNVYVTLLILLSLFRRSDVLSTHPPHHCRVPHPCHSSQWLEAWYQIRHHPHDRLFPILGPGHVIWAEHIRLCASARMSHALLVKV